MRCDLADPCGVHVLLAPQGYLSHRKGDDTLQVYIAGRRGGAALAQQRAVGRRLHRGHRRLAVPLAAQRGIWEHIRSRICQGQLAHSVVANAVNGSISGGAACSALTDAPYGRLAGNEVQKL